MGNALNFQKALVHTLNAGGYSVNELGLLDVVEAVLSLDDGINEGVESGHVSGVRSHSSVSSSSSLSISKELSTKTVVRVAEESVLVVSVHGGSILAEEFSLEVVHLGSSSVLDGSNLNMDSEGGSLESFSSVEEISERGGLHVLELGRDFRDNNGMGSVVSSEVSLISSIVIGDLSKVSSGLGSSNESAHVRVVGLAEDILVSGVVGGNRSDVDSVSRSEVGELQLGAESVPGVTRVVSKSDLVGVFIKLMDLSNSSLNIEVLSSSN